MQNGTWTCERARHLLSLMLHLLLKRQETKNVSLLQQASLPKLFAHLDWIKKTGMSTLPESASFGKFCWLRTICERYQASAEFHRQHRKTEGKMQLTQDINELFLRIVLIADLPWLRHVWQGKAIFTQHRGHAIIHLSRVYQDHKNRILNELAKFDNKIELFRKNSVLIKQELQRLHITANQKKNYIEEYFVSLI